jgi:hypothetical protein
VALASITPPSGRTTNGSSAVAVSGNASVIHHAAIHATSPATSQASRGIPAGAGRTSVSRKASRPTTNPMRLAAILNPSLPG